MDLRQRGEPFEKKFTQFSETEIENIALNYHNWQQFPSVGGVSEGRGGYKNIPEYCYSASLEEIRKKDYSLVPSKYIEFVNRDEQLDYGTQMETLQTELKDLFQQESELKQEVESVFKSLGYDL